MNTSAGETNFDGLNQPNHKRRRWWLWILVCCLAPVIVLGAAAYSVLTLDHDGAVLRKQVATATNADWQPKVQLSVGRLTLGLVRTGLAFVDRKEMADAKLALRAVKCASVGVYQRKTTAANSWSREQLLLDTDRAMSRRGWSRLVGVVDHKDAVLIYAPADYQADDSIDICLSVVNDRDLVVVSATISPEGLTELIERHTGADQWRSLKLAQD